MIFNSQLVAAIPKYVLFAKGNKMNRQASETGLH